MFERFLKLSGTEKLLFAESWILHLLTGLVLKVIPFRQIPRLFGKISKHDDNTGISKAKEKDENLENIKEAVRRASRVSPWKNKCLISSLVTRKMLNRRGISSRLSLGVCKLPDGRFMAHAWIRAGSYELVEEGVGYTEIYNF